MKSFFLLSLLFLVACSSKLDPSLKPPNKGDLAAQIPPNMRATPTDVDEEDFAPVVLPGDPVESAPTGATSNTLSGGAGSAGSSILPALPDADDLVWTDPDNPDQNLGSVEAAFTQPVKDPWQLSFQAASRLSFSEGKPLMIWFTDSRTSPTCKQLGRELLGVKSFEKWSEEKVVKLRVDTSPNEKDADLRGRKQAYAHALRKKFRVKGTPTVLVIGHEGETLGRYSGYKTGSGNYYWGRIKNAVSTFDDGYFNWRTSMEDKGYRMWEGENGVKLFAKLLKYKDGDLRVVEPNGRKTFFNESNLSADDQKWIQKQKNEE